MVINLYMHAQIIRLLIIMLFYTLLLFHIYNACTNNINAHIQNQNHVQFEAS